MTLALGIGETDVCAHLGRSAVYPLILRLSSIHVASIKEICQRRQRAGTWQCGCSGIRINDRLVAPNRPGKMRDSIRRRLILLGHGPTTYTTFPRAHLSWHGTTCVDVCHSRTLRYCKSAVPHRFGTALFLGTGSVHVQIRGCGQGSEVDARRCRGESEKNGPCPAVGLL